MRTNEKRDIALKQYLFISIVYSNLVYILKTKFRWYWACIALRFHFWMFNSPCYVNICIMFSKSSLL